MTDKELQKILAEMPDWKRQNALQFLQDVENQIGKGCLKCGRILESADIEYIDEYDPVIIWGEHLYCGKCFDEGKQ